MDPSQPLVYRSLPPPKMLLRRVLFPVARVRARYLRVSLPSTARKLKEFKLADIGEGITECEVIKWNVKPASSVQVFDPLCEVQSDKASVEITSPFDGVVRDILVNEGDVAKVGAGLCIIEVEESGSDAAHSGSAPLATLESATPPPQEQPSTSIIRDGSIKGEVKRAVPKSRPHPLDPRYSSESSETSQPSGKDVLATPSIRYFARQRDVDLTLLVPGSGKGGRIEKQDVEAYLAGSASKASEVETAAASLASDAEITIELGRTRLNMWKAMTKSLEIPQFGCTSTFDLTTLHDFLPMLNSHIPKHYLQKPQSHSPVPVVSPASFYPPPDPPAIPEFARYTRLTYLPFLMKTLSKAMAEWPLFRSSLTSQPNSSAADKPTLTIRPHADISIALSTPTGLYTPTIQHVNTRTVYEIASVLKHFAHLGRQVPCALTSAEMPKRGGTITISNVGGVGDVDSASPVLVPSGGVAIVAVGRAKWVWDVNGEDGKGARRLKVRISWSADHRVVEGAELIGFMELWRIWIEQPQRLIADSV
ncbi:CoA-dependent acyltransferase [Laetiporus sulphureus 93-53]|uniref:Dihydrolipoamide acetyltransferase component of pyruvate dehydrogenase complex n=1 Tax=Laetiporus sulphureus 93-53 TaxID=1314785 RepID=A0A165FJ06_9APHY|nr:CoA-dependent acyltransferase [Laetiporus sulphureus 93-53]KZT09044.1 CoA-dependent acyltransferase [Laetiporus sulphureus 93-53]